MALDLRHLQRELVDVSFFTQWIYHEEVGSTMDIARELAESGSPEGAVVIASAQRAGRGRRRGWESPAGGVWFSLLLRPLIDLGQAGCISILFAVAIAQTLRERYSLPVSVKWPNDLIVNGQKLGGILIELSTIGQRIDWLIAGIGINVNNPLPRQARIPPASLLGALGHEVPLEEFYMVILRGMARAYLRFLSEGFEPIRQQWEKLSALEENIVVQKGRECFAAQVRGLSESGKLIVERSGRMEELVAEEVSLRF